MKANDSDQSEVSKGDSLETLQFSWVSLGNKSDICISPKPKEMFEAHLSAWRHPEQLLKTNGGFISPRCFDSGGND